MPGVIN